MLNAAKTAGVGYGTVGREESLEGQLANHVRRFFWLMKVTGEGPFGGFVRGMRMEYGVWSTTLYASVTCDRPSADAWFLDLNGSSSVAVGRFHSYPSL